MFSTSIDRPESCVCVCACVYVCVCVCSTCVHLCVYLHACIWVLCDGCKVVFKTLDLDVQVLRAYLCMRSEKVAFLCDDSLLVCVVQEVVQ